MLSQVLSGDFFPDQPSATPGNDLPYILGLPTYAATAWYHAQPGHAVPPDRLAEVERFAIGPYAGALAAGSALDPGERDAIVEKLRDYTGLPAEYLRNANLRVAADAFRQALLRDRGLIVGGADTRYTGQTLDRMGRKAAYDPTDAGVTSAYVSSFNDYVRRELKYGEGKTYRVAVDDIGDKWNFRREPDGNGQERTANVLPDLAHAMKLNPLLKVQLNSGVFDLLTPYFQGHYEMRHLPVPAEIQANIEYRCFRSGHMVYLAPEERARLHDSVADFIERTSGAAGSKRPASPVCP